MPTETPPLQPDPIEARRQTVVRHWFVLNLGVPALYAALFPLTKHIPGDIGVLLWVFICFVLLMAGFNIRGAIVLGRGNAFAAFFIWAGSTALSVGVAWVGCAILQTF